MSRFNRVFAPLLLVLALLAVAPAAMALSEQELEQRVIEISNDLRCPTCQGLSVNDSEASFSLQIKNKVRRMLQEGQSEEQIKAYFVSRYGEWILRAPPKRGIGLVVWGLPFLGMAVVAGLLGWRLYRNQYGKPAAEGEAARPAEPDTGLTPEQLARIERDLKRYEEQD